jgi:GT2 family glycosyltransferase
VLPPDALIKLLESNKDIITGVYLQRKPGERIPEIYVSTGRGGTTNINPNKLLGTKPLEIAGCGFGCVLVSVDTLVSIGYPQFEYHNTIDFSDTISEDTDFCMKSKKKGIPIFVDPTLRCDHIGVTKYRL